MISKNHVRVAFMLMSIVSVSVVTGCQALSKDAANAAQEDQQAKTKLEAAKTKLAELEQKIAEENRQIEKKRAEEKAKAIAEASVSPLPTEKPSEQKTTATTATPTPQATPDQTKSLAVALKKINGLESKLNQLNANQAKIISDARKQAVADAQKEKAAAEAAAKVDEFNQKQLEAIQNKLAPKSSPETK